MTIAGITIHPTERWMKQMAWKVTMEGSGALGDGRYLLYDPDTKSQLPSWQSLSRCT
jgi:hypothetical protein